MNDRTTERQNDRMTERQNDRNDRTTERGNKYDKIKRGREVLWTLILDFDFASTLL